MDFSSNRLVSVVIVTTGVNNYISALLGSLLGQTYQNIEVSIIDNSGKPEVKNKIKESYPNVSLLTYECGLSYCESLNRGIEKSGGEFILCLNDDVKLDKDFISNALKGFDVEKQIGMVSGKVLRFDGRTLDSTGLFLSIFRSAKERGYGKLDSGQFNKNGFIFGVNGAVAFYRKSMLEQIKVEGEYFDNDFGFFYEDIDISWRAQNSGWKGYYVPGAVAFHFRGASVRSNSGLDKAGAFARQYLSYSLYRDLIKNRYLAIIKNETALNLLLPLCFHNPSNP